MSHRKGVLTFIIGLAILFIGLAPALGQRQEATPLQVCKGAWFDLSAASDSCKGPSNVNGPAEISYSNNQCVVETKCKYTDAAGSTSWRYNEFKGVHQAVADLLNCDGDLTLATSCN